MPKVSFLLPVHNGEQYLDETLVSLLAQDHDDFDVLVVDDGSTDGTAEIVDGFASNRLRYVFKPNGGLVETLNYGLSQLDCDFVARIDADDICFPGRLSSQLDFLAFTGAVAVSCKSLHIDEVGNVLGVSGAYPLFEADPRFLPAIEPYLPHPFLFARLDVLAGLGFREAHLAEDADLCWRLAEDYPIAMQGAVLGKYRLHTDSVSAASIASARVQAFFSQVAALNCIRRQEGRAELPYRVSMAEAKEAGAQGWGALMALYADDLTGDEAPRLRAASLLKLLDLATWRNYEPTVEDITEAARALRQVRGLDEANREKARALLSAVTEPERGFAERIRGFLGRD